MIKKNWYSSSLILERVIYETVIVEIWLGIRIEPNMEGNRKGLQIGVMIKTMIFELRLKQNFWDLRSFNFVWKWIKTRKIGESV